MTRPSSAPKAGGKPKPQAPPSDPVVKMKPHRGLFYALLGVFFLWIAFLVTLYFTTVYHKTDVHIEHATTELNP
ncbi:MAG TPA: hypothetical protein VHS31_00360 [Tepidisphaeraceae bacterium]|jgi:hypothetical protein|nr:hypothetical protein [Tepidisphaeraceae bacterium]